MTPAIGRRVLVTDAGRGSAIAIIRSLGGRGWHVVAADADRQSPGFHSRYAADRVVYPAPERDADAMVERLLAAARDRRVDLIVPVTDEVLLPISAARDRFRDVCALAIPDAEGLAVAEDKASTLELAAGCGVPVPRSFLVRTAGEAVERAGELGFPVVVKPIASRVRRSDGGIAALTVSLAGDRDQLAARVRDLAGLSPALVQEYCAGEGQGVEMLLDRGRPLAAFQHRRIREVPVTGGASACRESVPLDPVLFGHASRLLGQLHWTGLAMVEFKVGPAGPRLMEINGRIWGSLPLAVHCGVDFPAGLAGLVVDGAPTDAPTLLPSSYPVGIRMHNLDLEIVWVLSVLAGRRRGPFPAPRRSAAIAAALELVRPGAAFDVQVLSDPGPGLADLARIARKVARKGFGGR